MRALFGNRHDLAPIAVVGAIALLSLGVLAGREVNRLALLLVAVAAVATIRSSFVGWDKSIALILVVVLFVPIGRYSLPGNLPFHLELYRVVVAFCLLLWGASLLADSRVGFIRTAFDAPLLLIMTCVLASEVTNPSRVGSYGSYVIKSMTFFLSFILVYYLAATTLRRRESVDFLLKLLAGSGALIGIAAIVEQRTHYNIFDHLHTVFPFLHYEGALSYLSLGGHLRVFGPSEQPIALGAALVLLLPLAVYLARTSGRKWWVVALLILLGTMASGSRTAVIMLAVEAIVYLRLKPRETKRLWPALLPAVIVLHFALPGTIGSLKSAFFPKGGIIAQQSTIAANNDPLLAGGRIRELKPMLSEASHKPLFGEGYGTRITGFDIPQRNAPILDDEWLDTVLELGFVGLAAWIWLLVRANRRFFHASRTAEHPGDDWLFAAFAACITSFAFGMLTFDAFSFTQVTFIFWILLALSTTSLRLAAASSRSKAPAAVPLRVRSLPLS
jgi:polysaccharide biosynthesis protein PslJ